MEPDATSQMQEGKILALGKYQADSLLRELVFSAATSFGGVVVVKQ